MRTEVVPDATITDMKVFEEKVALAREIADVLRKNVVQAQKQEANDTWRTWNTSSALAFESRHVTLPGRVEYYRTYRTWGQHDNQESAADRVKSQREKTDEVRNPVFLPFSVDTHNLSRCCSA